MQIQRIDHVGVNVNDLAAAKAFFLDLGLEVVGEWQAEGERLDRVVGLDNVKTAAVMLRMPGGQSTLELVQFIAPTDARDVQRLPANAHGIRHIAFLVDDIEAVVAGLKAKGTETFSEIQVFEGQYKTCYIRGPEGIILELGEEIT